MNRVVFRHWGWGLAAMCASALLVAVGVRSFVARTGDTTPAVPPYDLFWCSKDEDCIRVDQVGCCECEQSGGQGAITKWHRDDLRLFLKGACRGKPVCVQIDTCRYDLQPRCEDHRCRLGTQVGGGDAG